MFSNKEQKILHLLQQNPGEIKYFEEIADYFITKSQLEISTFSQLAYINLSANESGAKAVTEALSEYFEVLVFIHKLEKADIVFHIPYTALEDNTVKIGPEQDNKVHKTIADADLLIQLFQYAGKKYVFTPVLKTGKISNKKSENADFFRIALLLILIVFIGVIAYHAHIERNQLELQQNQIGQSIKKNEAYISALEDQFRTNNKARFSEFKQLKGQFDNLYEQAGEQKKSLNYLQYLNRKQVNEFELVQTKLDTLINHNKKDQ